MDARSINAAHTSMSRPRTGDPSVANFLSTMTDQEFIEHARGYTAARGFSVIERLVKIIDNLNGDTCQRL